MMKPHFSLFLSLDYTGKYSTWVPKGPYDRSIARQGKVQIDCVTRRLAGSVLGIASTYGTWDGEITGEKEAITAPATKPFHCCSMIASWGRGCIPTATADVRHGLTAAWWRWRWRLCCCALFVQVSHTIIKYIGPRLPLFGFLYNSQVTVPISWSISTL